MSRAGCAEVYIKYGGVHLPTSTTTNLKERNYYERIYKTSNTHRGDLSDRFIKFNFRSIQLTKRSKAPNCLSSDHSTSCVGDCDLVFSFCGNRIQNGRRSVSVSFRKVTIANRSIFSIASSFRTAAGCTFVSQPMGELQIYASDS